jgi:hypothetical protein
MSYVDYLKEYYDIDVEKINDEWENGRVERLKKQLSGLKKQHENNKGKSVKERLGEDGYNNFRNNMKGVFSIEWYTKKYGEKEGKIKYKKRCDEIRKSSKISEYQNEQQWSKISQKMFWNIYDIIKNDYKKIYFGELNHEYSCGTRNNFDFVVLDNKKVIEFNGDKFHANPKMYEKNDIPLNFIGKTAEELWKEDEKKKKNIEKKGYKLLTIWENDYIKNKEMCILECIKFIKR